MGKGAVKLTFHGVRYTISNVYWVPELKNNLLSAGQIQDKRVAVLFEEGVCRVYHKCKLAVILRTKPSTTTNGGICLQVSSTDQSTLWHHRYGHLGYKGLCTLKHKNMVK